MLSSVLRIAGNHLYTIDNQALTLLIIHSIHQFLTNFLTVYDGGGSVDYNLLKEISIAKKYTSCASFLYEFLGDQHTNYTYHGRALTKILHQLSTSWAAVI